MNPFTKKKEYRTRNGRKSLRLKAGYLLKYQVIDGGLPGSVEVAHTKDISTGGVRFWLNEAIEVNALLNLQILIPPLSRAFHAIGKVARVLKEEKNGIYYVSVEFLEVPRGDAESLEAFIENRRFTRENRVIIDEPEVVTRSIEASHA